MTDDRSKTPAVRAGTIHGDRNENRRATPRGVPILAAPHEVSEDEDITTQFKLGLITEDERDQRRRKRPTHAAIAHLVKTKDEHTVLIAGMDGKLGILVKHAEDTEAYRRAREQREQEAAERERVRKWILGVIAGIAAAVVTIIAAVR